MNEQSTTKSTYPQKPQQHHKPKLRPLHYLMEPEELTPEERLDRIIDILAEVVISEDRAEEAA